ncbi:Retrovirus-related Pol polyprotein from transposon TNT 1-94 [Cardamine amara subsp. amara]|uniref:Retrovirus-related Pol polyprotein from transposon TNT 1-94 n=1 Tax=Cardamine amara subsp. amara TaxID=228776 RepID=A0ABD1A9M3_CARAN
MVNRQFHTDVRMIRSDNGSEFVVLKSWFASQGIIHQTSCVGTPQQNGRVERKHRYILDVARSLRFQADLPLEFWGDCVLTACYLINRTPSTFLSGKTPHEVLFNQPPSFDHLRIFGCLCYAHKGTVVRKKFDERASRCVFLGYPYNQKGWRVYDLEKREYFVSRNVVFNESFSRLPLLLLFHQVWFLFLLNLSLLR